MFTSTTSTSITAALTLRNTTTTPPLQGCEGLGLAPFRLMKSMLTIVAAAAVRDAIFRKCRFCLTATRSPAALQMQIAAAESATSTAKMQTASGDCASFPPYHFLQRATVRSRSRPRGGTSLACPHAATQPRLRRALSRFRWQVPARYNIGVDVCDRWAARDPARVAILHVHGGRHGEDVSYGALSETSNRLANALARARRRARRPGRDPAAADARGRGRAYRDLQARRDRAAARASVRRRSAGLSAGEFRREGADHQRARAREARESAATCPTSKFVLSIDGAGRWRARLRRLLARALRRFHAGRHRRRRSGADDLHLRHHRPAEGRAARASRAARPSARHRDAARFLAAAGRPVLDAGRLGLGGRPARCACCRACITACRWWRAASTSSIRKRRSR